MRCYAFLQATLQDEGGDTELAAGVRRLALPRLLDDPKKATRLRDSIIEAVEEAAGGKIEGPKREPISELVDSPPDEPQRVAGILAPYRAIQPLIESGDAMSRDEVDEILRLGAACAPPVLGVLRNWARDAQDADDSKAEAALGILGEIGGPEHLPPVLECLSDDPEDMVGEAATWAALRLAERYPELRPQVRGLSPSPYGLDVYELCGVLEEGPEGEDKGTDTLSLVWLQRAPPGNESRRVIANLALTRNELVIEARSRRRIEDAAAFLANLGGELVREKDRSFRTVREALREKPVATEGNPKSELPPEFKERVIGEHLEAHYRDWPDTSLPALDGHTPREAARDPVLRDRLVDLLKCFANVEERKRRKEEPAYDVSRLKAELGIDF